MRVFKDRARSVGFGRIGTIDEPTIMSEYLFLWREVVFRHGFPFLLMRPHQRCLLLIFRHALKQFVYQADVTVVGILACIWFVKLWIPTAEWLNSRTPAAQRQP